MAEQSLAVRYRPKTFDDVVEQDSVKKILRQQLETDTIKNAYLFCGGAGTGKTTCARIFANEINKGKGEPFELDAASNNSADDVRRIIQQSRTQSIDSEYRIWIIDECHALSNNAWQAFLKVLEEPSKKSIFIFCTTDPQKIPKTILSRVQRYDFQRISYLSIVERLGVVYLSEGHNTLSDGSGDALGYIAKLAQGGMRDAITMLDKCLSYSTDLSVESVVKALGTVDYGTFFMLTDAINDRNSESIIRIVEKVHSEGKDLKQFIKSYMAFLLDIVKYDITKSFEFLQLPNIYENKLSAYQNEYGWFENCQRLLDVIVKLNSAIKWDTQPKVLIEATLLGVLKDE